MKKKRKIQGNKKNKLSFADGLRRQHQHEIDFQWTSIPYFRGIIIGSSFLRFRESIDIFIFLSKNIPKRDFQPTYENDGFFG